MAMHDCFAVVLPGLEAIAAEELRSLGVAAAAQTGGLTFAASDDALYRLHLRARTITRVRVRLGEATALSIPELYDKTRRQPWEHFLPRGARPHIQADAHRSRLTHTGRIARAVADGIAARLAAHGRRGDPAKPAGVFVRLEANRCVFSVDASGARLDRRGWRLDPGPAPLRETLAAALLMAAGHTGEVDLLAPFCGSGTLAIEGAMIAARIAPGLSRGFAFEQWPIFKPKRFQRVRERALAMRREPPAAIHASDRDAAAIARAQANAERAGVADAVRIDVRDALRLEPPAGTGEGLIACNPPFGARLGSHAEAAALYAALAQRLRCRFPGWRAVVICADTAQVRALGASH
ncbi:MAG: RNA methyltransferase, partial [Mariprofundaceae bacterium]